MPDWLEINADLHFHGKFAGAVSERMEPEVIAEQAPLKGLQLVCTGDILHAGWQKLVKEQLKPAGGGILEHKNGTKFLLQTEVEDNNRVHHLILFPEWSKVEEVREKLTGKCKDLDSDGRQKLWVSGEELAQIAVDAGCEIGFSHAFTPFFGIYAHYKSYKECYGSLAEKVHFCELGLSADTNMADRISELHNLTFTSNSDSHSPWPNKLGREFNRLQIKEITFEEVSKALRREQGRKCILNVKFNPAEGKYNQTRCMGCLLFFKIKEAERFGWRCPECKRPIKKGVDQRIGELADLPEGKHPEHRPPCMHIIPLSEIIAISLGIKQAWSQKVQDLWKEFVKAFGSEIKALIDTPIGELEKIHKPTAGLVQAFREGKFRYIPGGAGVYGIPVPPGKPFEIKYFESKQASLSSFSKKA